MGTGFRLKKAFSKTFNDKNMKFGRLMGVSMAASLSALGVTMALEDQPEARDGVPFSAETYVQYKHDIAKLGRENAEAFTLKREHAAAEESLSYANPKDIAALKAKIDAMEKRERHLAADLKDPDKALFEKMTLDTQLAESDVSYLVKEYGKAMNREVSPDLRNLAYAKTYLNECRALSVADVSAVLSCASAKTATAVGHRGDMQGYAGFGGLGLFTLLTLIGQSMRRRVEVEEVEMKDNEVREGVAQLREMLKPKGPQL